METQRWCGWNLECLAGQERSDLSQFEPMMVVIESHMKTFGLHLKGKGGIKGGSQAVDCGDGSCRSGGRALMD